MPSNICVNLPCRYLPTDWWWRWSLRTSVGPGWSRCDLSQFWCLTELPLERSCNYRCWGDWVKGLWDSIVSGEGNSSPGSLSAPVPFCLVLTSASPSAIVRSQPQAPRSPWGFCARGIWGRRNVRSYCVGWDTCDHRDNFVTGKHGGILLGSLTQRGLKRFPIVCRVWTTPQTQRHTWD